ncbi:MAG: DUF2357 domain-containing protein [Lachnospiraceae bacterium]|nr:DUF2357 domain-containing protein [Lachnospiraceae bacterium]
MAPKFGDIGQMEELSAGETPSSEGAWWIMLQTAESICNAASLRDPVNNAYMSEFWSEAAPEVEKYVSQDGNRPLPYDDLMQMVSFCGDHLQEIVKNPRHNLVKADRMVRPEKAKDIGYKTIHWLGKQPGRSVREKMAGKSTLLTQKKEYSYDIKENQVAMMLYLQLMRRVSDRINNGIKKEAYDVTESAQMEQMRKIKKLLRESPLGEVKAKNQNQANNVLLSDKHYSVIWRAYMDMSRFDARVEKRWEQALELYVKSVFLAINAELCTYDDLYVVEDRVKLQNTQKMRIAYILGYHYRIPYVVELVLDGKVVSVRIYDSPLYDGNKAEYIKELKFTFSATASKENLIARRGTPLCVEVKEDGRTQKKLCYADLSCVKEIVSICRESCFDFADIEPVKVKEEEYVKNGFTASVSFDIVSNGGQIGIADDKIWSRDRFYSDKAVTYKNKSGFAAVYPNGLRQLHMRAGEEIAVRNAVLAEDSRGLKVVLDEIHDKVTLGQDDYFFYLVPDALEEIRQKNLKQCVKGCFTRTFPVWRSVAGLVTWLANPDYKFDEESIFVYLDLVGDTATAGMMTIHYEDILKNYTCNHFPPFPQNEEGDSITEDAFCESYVREYAKKYKFRISEDAVKHLVEDGSIRELLSDCEAAPYANYFYENKGIISMYQITYDANLIDICVNGWLERIYKFWNMVSGKLGSKNANYVYFISDLLIQFVTEADLKTLFTEKQWSNIRGIFQSDTKKLLEGALIYKDRLNHHLPIWTEYLPKLSLKIPKQGKYVDRNLIDENMSINVMDDDTEFPIKEQTPLRLHAGADEYYFELKKEDISRRPSRIEAYISVKSKLEYDVDVNMFIRYKYGSDESYELILRPINTQKAPFEEIKAEWRSGYREKKHVGGPKFPPLKSSEEIDSDIKGIKEKLEKTFGILRKFLKFQYSYDNVSERFEFERNANYMSANTFKLRETLRYYEINENVQKFVEWFFGSGICKICIELMTLNPDGGLSWEFYKDYADTSGMKLLQNGAAELIYSFGAYVPREYQEYLATYYQELSFKRKQSVLLNAVYKNTDNDELWYLFLDLMRKKRGIILNIRGVSNLCWCDEDMIPKIGMYRALVSEMVNACVTYLKELRYVTASDPKYQVKVKSYLSVIEVILAILRLREDPEFDLLVAGSKEATELADLIREVDDTMGNPESRIKLMVNKPDALRNMSNIAYAIDMYLTGNEGVDSIEVLSVESDE